MILLRERFQEGLKDSRKSLNCIPLRFEWNVPKVQRLTPEGLICQGLNWEQCNSDKTSVGADSLVRRKVARIARRVT